MPQQRRARATREAILTAAAEEFDRVGYAAAPLSAILRRGGVTKGAFYFHFPSKEAVAEAVVRHMRAVWPAAHRRWRDRGLDPLRTLIGLLDEVARRLCGDVVARAAVRLAEEGQPAASRPSPFRAWERTFALLLGAAAERGLLRPGVDPEAAARVLHAAVIGAWLVDGPRQGTGAYPQRIGEVVRCLLPGVATDEWLAGWRAEQP
ncbi:ScbR family autoregulator-binding transcription factor [Gandjariella thermophila]|uniref:TetR family transcriptional regulator n=1 Tax=Gandjariella thermophila TaxID=1931992 RepID=A0A4D4IYQ8_9PSEU|nr:ScbR family autoregulator-binding transcription factor [Gandjariella thermophila]GDY29525.1 TetR family transcriptional regulator [Gandjariella thermophila]